MPDGPVRPGSATVAGGTPLVPADLHVEAPPGLFPTLPIDGVFEGGGALGTAYVGVLRLLDDSGMSFARVAGNSAGAITAAMIAAGFTAREIEALSSPFNGLGSLPESLNR